MMILAIDEKLYFINVTSFNLILKPK